MSNVKSKKPTNKDVAELAGVSVATVSYVINGRTDKRIPEETRKKVLHAINFLGYVPNPHATAMKTAVKDIVVKTSKQNSTLQNAELFATLKKLTRIFAEKDYWVSFCAEEQPRRLTASACVCIGCENDEFHALANENFIPLIAVDSLVNDPVFYQVCTDYRALKEQAEKALGKDFVYIAVTPVNNELKDEITAVIPQTIFVTDLTDLQNLPSDKVMVSDYVLAEILGSKVLSLTERKTEKLAAVIGCVENAINREVLSDAMHFVKV